MHASRTLRVLLILALSAGIAHAGSIDPTYDTFGTLSGATFGGTGIPNDAVAITSITDGSATLTLGLTAHGRHDNPAVGNDGAGTFFAQPGSNVKGGLLGALWNFAFYIDLGSNDFADYGVQLLYDFGPAADTDESDLGVLDFNALIATSFDPGTISKVEGSENLLFGYLANGSLPFITVPTPSSFSPYASGEYSFALVATDLAGNELGRAAINVNVAPLPSAAAAGLALLGTLAILRRRRRK
jgi:hypothetical protein